MIRAMVVDDDPVFLEWIERCFDWSRTGAVLVKTACNGVDAVAKLRNANIDLLLVDVKMPLMDGTRLVEKLLCEEPRYVVAMLSAVRDFDVAHRTLNAGVSGYVLKSAAEEELVESLQRLVRVVEKRRAAIPLDSARLKAAGIGAILWSMISSPVQDDELIERLSSLLDMDARRAGVGVTCLVVRSGHGADPDMESFASTIRSADIDARRKDRSERVVFTSAGEVVVVDLYNEPTGSSFRDSDRVARAQSYTECIRREHDADAWAGVGLTGAGANSIRESYRQAAESLNFVPYLEGTRTAVYRPVEWEEAVRRDDLLEVFELAAQSKCLRPARHMEAIRRITNRLRAEPCYTIGALRALFGPVLAQDDPRSSANRPTTHGLSPAITLSELEKQVETVLSSPGSRFSREGADVVEAVKHAITSDLSVNRGVGELADWAGVSTDHLNRMFHRQEGFTIGKFICRVRMEEACRLLRESDLRIGDIAKRTGFSDQRYFARAFHAYTGVSPTEYRLERS